MAPLAARGDGFAPRVPLDDLRIRDPAGEQPLDLGARESTELMANGIVTLREDATAPS